MTSVRKLKWVCTLIWGQSFFFALSDDLCLNHTLPQVCDYLCTVFSDGLSQPFFYLFLSILSSSQTAVRCVSQVQSLNSASLPEETLYLPRLYGVRGEYPRADLSCTALKMTRSAPHTVFTPPTLLTSALLLWRFVWQTCHCVGLLCWFSVGSQGAERVQEGLGGRPQGVFYSQSWLWHLSHGFKGGRRLFLWRLSLHLKNTDLPVAPDQVLQLIFFSHHKV